MKTPVPLRHRADALWCWVGVPWPLCGVSLGLTLSWSDFLLILLLLFSSLKTLLGAGLGEVEGAGGMDG